MPPRHYRKPKPVKQRVDVDPPHIAQVCGWCKEILRPVDTARDDASVTRYACADRAACCERLRAQAFYERTRGEL